MELDFWIDGDWVQKNPLWFLTIEGEWNHNIDCPASEAGMQKNETKLERTQWFESSGKDIKR
jgi:hypothetical protein